MAGESNEATLPPIDGNRWGTWNSEAATRWDVVTRSWKIFERNTTELVQLLKGPATNIGLSLMLMGDDRDAAEDFWQELDQRLHNQLAGAASLVDHVRRLTDYYAEDAPELVKEFKRRNDEVFAMDEAAFLRRLRNYLLHYGVPPIVQTLSLSMPQGAMPEHSIKLSAPYLLKWDGWSGQAKNYLCKFADRDGPVIASVVVDYGNAMAELYFWLFGQRAEIMRTPPERFRMEPPAQE